jgi:arylsulfatase A-like enzyme
MIPLLPLKCALAFIALASGVAASPSSRPNVLLVLAEDISPDLGCYGTPLVSSPAIDRFAREGIRFTHCWTTGSACSPSRSALMAGRYQTAIGAHHQRTRNRQPLPAGMRTITEHLRDAGYYPAMIHEKRSSPGPTGDAGQNKTDYNFATTRPFDGATWQDCRQHQPFFAQITLADTHKGGWGWTHPEASPSRVNPAKLKLPAYYPDHPVARAEYAGYLDAIAVLDQSFAAVLQRLAREGLAENTVVLFMGDNGRGMFREKQYAYNESFHVPLLLRWPDRRAAGTVDARLISAIDVSAAILGLAGLDPAALGLHGRDLLNPAVPERDHLVGARDRMGMMIDRMRAIRTRRYHYIRNFLPTIPYLQVSPYMEAESPTWNLIPALAARGALSPEAALFAAPVKPIEEFYDLHTDPDQVRNLARDPAARAELRRHRALLDRWLADYPDLGAVMEDPLQSGYTYP